MPKRRKTSPPSMTPEKVRAVQELRRSNAAGPINPKKPSRRDARRGAINESKDN